MTRHRAPATRHVARLALPAVGAAASACLFAGQAPAAVGGTLAYNPGTNSVIGIIVNPVDGPNPAKGGASVLPTGLDQAAGAIALGQGSTAVSSAGFSSAAGAIALGGGQAGSIDTTDPANPQLTPAADAQDSSTAGAIAVGDGAVAGPASATGGSRAGSIAIGAGSVSGATAANESEAGSVSLLGGQSSAQAGQQGDAQAYATGPGAIATAFAPTGGVSIALSTGAGAQTSSFSGGTGDVSISWAGPGGTASASPNGATVSTGGPALAYNLTSGQFAANLGPFTLPTPAPLP